MSNHRASLLTGLRTGGPRSVSNGGYNNLPQTASIGGQFPQLANQFSPAYGYERDDAPFTNVPMTAPAKDISLAQMQHQQQHAQLLMLQAQAVQNAVMNGQANGNYGISPDQQALQLQYEMYKMQALQQQQQLQAQLLAQAQLHMQQNQISPSRRPSEPITAGPYTTSFPAPRNRTSSAHDGPMTAALDGRFGGGKSNSGLNPNASSFQIGGNETVPSVVSNNWRSTSVSQPPNSATTGVISGGTLLGAAASSPAKHNTASSWRRPSVVKDTSRTPSPDGSLSASPPTVYVSTPEETSPSQSRSVSPPTHRARPQPLHFNIPFTIQDENELDGGEGQIIPMSPRLAEIPSSPSTPTSGSSGQSAAREEASRRLYEGLGIGRPVPQTAPLEARVGTQPSRQPRGPPSGVEDLGARNFAARLRRKAIGGLETLMDARNRRTSMIEMVEAY